MKLIIILFLTSFNALSACNGENSSQDISTTALRHPGIASAGDTVQALGSNIMLVYQDRKNNYWFGSWKDGLYHYDGKTLLLFTTESGLPGNRIEEIQEDKSGNIYFTTDGGICTFQEGTFTTLTPSDSPGKWQLSPNDLWFKSGWNSGYVYRYDGTTLYKLALPKTEIGETHVANHPNNPNPYTIYSIYKDRKGNVWFGTGALGAFRYNGKQFDWIQERDVVEIYNKGSEGSNGVRSIIEDAEGYFWFNSNYRYQVYGSPELLPGTSDSSFYRREKSIGSLDGQAGGNLNEYLSIEKDNNKELWIATYEDGVFHYDGAGITRYSVTDSIGKIHLFRIYKDNLGVLWLGTPESGVYKFNGQSFERFKP